MSTPPASPALPLFYARPRILDRALDARKKIKRLGDFSFAAKANAIPVVTDEFFVAAAFYPIVFLQAPQPVPAAVVGVTPGRNLFVSPNGQWQYSAYVPAYVRRYPFILVDDPASKQLLLCVDEASSLFGDSGDHPLFDGDKPSEVTDNAMQFCAVLRQQGEHTDGFVKALQEHELLIPQEVNVQSPTSGEKHTVNGFMNISEEKLRELPDKVYLDWRTKGWIGAIHAHIVSQHHWLHYGQLLANAPQ